MALQRKIQEKAVGVTNEGWIELNKKKAFDRLRLIKSYEKLEKELEGDKE